MISKDGKLLQPWGDDCYYLLVCCKITRCMFELNWDAFPNFTEVNKIWNLTFITVIFCNGDRQGPRWRKVMPWRDRGFSQKCTLYQGISSISVSATSEHQHISSISSISASGGWCGGDIEGHMGGDIGVTWGVVWGWHCVVLSCIGLAVLIWSEYWCWAENLKTFTAGSIVY